MSVKGMNLRAFHGYIMLHILHYTCMHPTTCITQIQEGTGEVPLAAMDFGLPPAPTCLDEGAWFTGKAGCTQPLFFTWPLARATCRPIPSKPYKILNPLGVEHCWKLCACAGAYAERISSLAVGGVYLLAGVPETVELCLNVAGGLVDTHVLMTLAALGLLALGQASEVRGACFPQRPPSPICIARLKCSTCEVLLVVLPKQRPSPRDWCHASLYELLSCRWKHCR